MSNLLDQSEIFGVLQGFNPWWAGRSAYVPRFRRLAYQVCRRYLDNPALRRGVLLSGPRRVGKTTIVTQVADAFLTEGRDPKSICYLSLDHPLLKLLTVPQILRLYHETMYPEGQPALLLLDELQYAAEWELHLKQLIDHKPEYRILATGSASVVHRQKVAESGVGRWVTVPIPTLSFYEFLQIRREDTSAIPADLRPSDLFNLPERDLAPLAATFRSVMPLFQRYLLVGGFPETARQDDVALCQRLLREDVVERVLKRDMAALFHIRNINDAEKLFIYICLNSGGLFSLTRCASELGNTKATVSNHLDALQQANLIYRLPPYGLGGKKVLKARPKIYLVDAALRNAVLLRGEEILKDPDQIGPIVETTVLRHLYAYYYRDVPDIQYWYDSARKREVDIIVSSPSYLIPAEVKYREQAALTPDSGLAHFCRQESVSQAYWVTRREEDFGRLTLPDIDTVFLRVPAHIFVYLLGQAERILWTGPRARDEQQEVRRQ
jgi:hypothetical protein